MAYEKGTRAEGAWPARSRSFDELSVTKFAVLGGLGGLGVALLPWPLVALGLVPVGFNLWPVVPAIVVPFTLVGAIVAPGTLALARLTQDRPLLEDGEAVDDVGLTKCGKARAVGGFDLTANGGFLRAR